MSEQYFPPEIAAQEYEDVLDALKMAFFNEPLKNCTVDMLQFIPREGDEWINCKRREKRAYDPSRGCPVIVTHYTYECVNERGMQHKDVITIDWDDELETNIILDLHNSSMGSYLYEDGEFDKYVTYDEPEISKGRIQMKMGLAAVTTL